MSDKKGTFSDTDTVMADTASSWSMLPRDKNGVVDSKLRVHGTINIRVADLSIIPLQPVVHPQGRLHSV